MSEFKFSLIWFTIDCLSLLFLKENCIGECFFTPFCGLCSRILLYFHMCVCHDVASVTSQLLNHLMISTIKNIYFLKAYHLGNFRSSPLRHMIWWSSWSGPHFQLQLKDSKCRISIIYLVLDPLQLLLFPHFKWTWKWKKWALSYHIISKPDNSFERSLLCPLEIWCFLSRVKPYR